MLFMGFIVGDDWLLDDLKKVRVIGG